QKCARQIVWRHSKNFEFIYPKTNFIMKKLILAAAVAFYSHNIHSQSECETAARPAPLLCGNLIDFYPSGSNVLTIPVNFIYFKPTSGTGKFDARTTTDCNNTIAVLNSKMSNILNPTMVLPSGPTTVADTKIRFSFKSISFVTTSLYNSTPVAVFPTSYV